MSMDLHGLEPQSRYGEVLRLSVWVWHPLWEFVEQEYPNLVGKVRGHVNSGDELNKETSQLLYEKMSNDFLNGNIQNYIDKYNDFLDSIPKWECVPCLGLGKKRRGIFHQTNDVCVNCQGSGKAFSYIKNYSFSVGDVYFFLEFLKDCGGFKIL